MAFALPVFILSLFCSYFQCEVEPVPPYLHLNMDKGKRLVSSLTGYRGMKMQGTSEVVGPVVSTKLGKVEGHIGQSSEGRDIYKFTGIPFGEPPIGHLRFNDPMPKKPWKGILKATTESPYCIQTNAPTMWMVTGQEDCLYLDVHTPWLPKSTEETKGPGLPVIIWTPEGGHMLGRSLAIGSAYLLNEDVVLVAINVRMGLLGFLATGDKASPGNWGLKDEALSVQWVYENIADFGGDPNRIILGGMSSGSASVHAMLFTNNKARNHIKGILGMSGSVFANHDLDGKGRVQEASKMAASLAGCPTSAEGRSMEMVECMRKIDPYMLAVYQSTVALELPQMSKMWGPTIEPNVTNAFISELPETLYEKGMVPPIPLILTRTEDELGLYFQAIRFSILPLLYKLNWYKWMAAVLKLTYRNTKLGERVSEEQALASIRKLNKYYLGKDAPPRMLNENELDNWAKMIADGLFNMPVWKALELHNNVGPTYSYIMKHQTFRLNPLMRLGEQLLKDGLGAPHMSDLMLIFNNTKVSPNLKKGSEMETASKNLINMIVNFATYGKPLYRTPSGKLLPLWTTIGDVNHMKVLDVGLVHNISMVLDPIPSTMRMKIWEQVKF